MRQGSCDPATGEGQRALVLGATSLVAEPLLARLVEEGFQVTAVSRQPLPGGTVLAGATWQVGDLGGGWTPGHDVPIAVHLAPLWLLPPLVGPLARRGLRRLVAFGSTSRFTRARSPSAPDRHLARRFERAEAELDRAARDHGVGWTVLRPTLIYGGGGDRSVAPMARFARRFGFIPVAGRARGLRQPVKAEDLAEACLAVLREPATCCRAYDLPGGETLTFGEMAERVSVHALGRRSLLRLPTPLLRGLLSLASKLPAFSQLEPRMADRMNEDLVFEAADARRDFGWNPGPFELPREEARC